MRKTSATSVLISEIASLKDAATMMADFIPQLVKKARHAGVQHALKHYQRLMFIHSNALASLLDELPVTGKVTQMPAKAMHAIIDDARELLKLPEDETWIDLLLIATVQKMQQYKASCLQAALLLSFGEESNTLHRKLKQLAEEEGSDASLFTELAQSFLHQLMQGRSEENFSTAPGGNRPASDQRKTHGDHSSQSAGNRGGSSHRTYPGGEPRGH